MPDDIKDAIEEGAVGPASVSTDGVTVTQRSTRELIEADRYAEANRATQRGLGIKRTKIVPPGAV